MLPAAADDVLAGLRVQRPGQPEQGRGCRSLPWHQEGQFPRDLQPDGERAAAGGYVCPQPVAWLWGPREGPPLRAGWAEARGPSPEGDLTAVNARCPPVPRSVLQAPRGPPGPADGLPGHVGAQVPAHLAGRTPLPQTPEPLGSGWRLCWGERTLQNRSRDLPCPAAPEHETQRGPGRALISLSVQAAARGRVGEALLRPGGAASCSLCLGGLVGGRDEPRCSPHCGAGGRVPRLVRRDRRGSVLCPAVCENGWRCCLINRDRKMPTDYIRNGVLYVTEK